MKAVAVLRGKNNVNACGIGMLDSDCHSSYPLSFLYIYYTPNREKSQVICLLIRRSVPSNLHLLKKISGCPLIYGYVRDAVGFFVVDEAIAVPALNPEADVETIFDGVRNSLLDGDAVALGLFVNLVGGRVDYCAKFFNGHHVHGDGSGIGGDGVESLVHGEYLSFI